MYRSKVLANIHIYLYYGSSGPPLGRIVLSASMFSSLLEQHFATTSAKHSTVQSVAKTVGYHYEYHHKSMIN